MSNYYTTLSKSIKAAGILDVCELTVWIRWGCCPAWQLLGLRNHCTGLHSGRIHLLQTGKKTCMHGDSRFWCVCNAYKHVFFLCQHFCVPPILTNYIQTGRGESRERHKSELQTHRHYRSFTLSNLRSVFKHFLTSLKNTFHNIVGIILNKQHNPQRSNAGYSTEVREKRSMNMWYGAVKVIQR